jgi:scyllo-inositol 2-dehydrogenase (NADP+)
MSNSTSKDSSGPIRLGLVGCGRAGMGMHCGELSSKTDKFQIVAAYDEIPERVAQMSEKYEACKGYDRYDDLLADDNVEIVDIATRSVDHFLHASQALKAGKSVLLEKPITATYDEAVKLKKLADNSPGSLYIRHNRRFESGFQHIREIMASGILGDVYDIKLRRHGYQRRNDWQTIKEYGGGQLLNWGPHVVDHALQLLESPVAEMWSDLKRVAAVGDAEDHVRIILRGENGRVVDAGISGGAAIGEPEFFVLGTRGALTCTGGTITMRYIDPARLPEPIEADPATPASGGFGNAESLPWVNCTITVSPKTGCTVDGTIWDVLYSAFREGADYPITLDEAAGVMEIISKTKEGTEF